MSTDRERVIAEAQSWLGTPFHHEARIKHSGVDCLMFLAEVYERAGIIVHVEVEHYPPDWYRHRDQERYLEGLLRYTREVEVPAPADVVIFRQGRTFSHGAIVIDWPTIIHAHWGYGVVWGNAERQFDLQYKARKFFSPFAES